MDRALFAEITAMAMGRMRAVGFSMPASRFFMPNNGFWSLISEVTKGRHGVLEVGAGSGDLWREALQYGVSIQCIDTCPRDGAPHVLIEDATDFDYRPGMLVLCCRPDHSGWAAHARSQALACGASFAYVGLERNYVLDLDDDALGSIDYMSDFEVGEDGEKLIGWGDLFESVPMLRSLAFSEDVPE